MSLTITNNTNISRILSADVGGKPQTVATMTGHVVPGKSMALSVVLTNAELAAANKEDLSSAFDAFVVDVRAMAAANDFPV